MGFSRIGMQSVLLAALPFVSAVRAKFLPVVLSQRLWSSQLLHYVTSVLLGASPLLLQRLAAAHTGTADDAMRAVQKGPQFFLVQVTDEWSEWLLVLDTFLLYALLLRLLWALGQWLLHSLHKNTAAPPTAAESAGARAEAHGLVDINQQHFARAAIRHTETASANVYRDGRGDVVKYGRMHLLTRYWKAWVWEKRGWRRRSAALRRVTRRLRWLRLERTFLHWHQTKLTPCRRPSSIEHFHAAGEATHAHGIAAVSEAFRRWRKSARARTPPLWRLRSHDIGIAAVSEAFRRWRKSARARTPPLRRARSPAIPAPPSTPRARPHESPQHHRDMQAPRSPQTVGAVADRTRSALPLLGSQHAAAHLEPFVHPSMVSGLATQSDTHHRRRMQRRKIASDREWASSLRR